METVKKPRPPTSAWLQWGFPQIKPSTPYEPRIKMDMSARKQQLRSTELKRMCCIAWQALDKQA